MNEGITPILWGGVGLKDSNNGTQWKQQNRVYRADKIAISMCVSFNPWYIIKGVENMENKVLIKQATNKGFEELGLPGVADLSFPNSTTRRGRVQDKGRIAPCLETSNTGLTVFENRYDEPFRTFKDGVVGTLRTVEACGDKCVVEQKETNYKIRKLTPRECWRLMGFNDTDFDAAEKVNSNTQLYKQAGNSIVVNVLEELFKSLIE